MKKIPFYLRNPFWSAFHESHKRLLTLLVHYIGQLKAGGEALSVLLTEIQAEYELYVALYNAVINYKGSRKGETSRLSDAFDTLTPKLRRWNLQIQLEYPEKTPEYIAIFPGGLTVFHKGTIEQQLQQVNALILRLVNYPSLQNVLTEIKDYADSMTHTRILQEQLSGSLGDTIDKLNEKRNAICLMLYAHLGYLIWKNAANPEVIENFFPPALLHIRKNNAGDEQEATGDLLATVKDANANLLPGVTIQVNGTAATDQTDENGEANFFDLVPGNHTITCTLEGYQTTTDTVNIVAGKETETKVVLPKA